MVNLILISHGTFAEGLLNATELIIGEQKNVKTFALNEGDSIEQLELDVEDAIKELSQDAEVLVLVDLFGASPCNVSVRLVQRYPGVKIVTGMNLPMMIEVAMNREHMSAAELVEYAAETGQKHCKSLEGWLAGFEDDPFEA